jgi:hypothetical protein
MRQKWGVKKFLFGRTEARRSMRGRTTHGYLSETTIPLANAVEYQLRGSFATEPRQPQIRQAERLSSVIVGFRQVV